MQPEFTEEELKGFEERVQKALKHGHKEHVDPRLAEAVRRHEDEVVDRLGKGAYTLPVDLEVAVTMVDKADKHGRNLPSIIHY